MNVDISKYLFKGRTFLELLNASEKKYFLRHVSRKEYKKGQNLFKEGAFPKGLYILKKGRVKLFQSDRNGRDNVVYIYKKGDYFGYRPLLCEETHPAAASAIDNVVLLFLPEAHFFSLLKGSRALAQQLLVNLAHEFSVWVNKLTLFAQYSVKERVALSLLILSEEFAGGENQAKPVISISREDLAGFVGTTKETLVRMLRLMKDDKIISTKGSKIVVLRRSALHDAISTL